MKASWKERKAEQEGRRKKDVLYVLDEEKVKRGRERGKRKERDGERGRRGGRRPHEESKVKRKMYKDSGMDGQIARRGKATELGEGDFKRSPRKAPRKKILRK
eukprot:scaffold282914_cov17-Tisochrysis_lutea.AAC.1